MYICQTVTMRNGSFQDITAHGRRIVASHQASTQHVHTQFTLGLHGVAETAEVVGGQVSSGPCGLAIEDGACWCREEALLSEFCALAWCRAGDDCWLAGWIRFGHRPLGSDAGMTVLVSICPSVARMQLLLAWPGWGAMFPRIHNCRFVTRAKH